jgi:hypothetical protein
MGVFDSKHCLIMYAKIVTMVLKKNAISPHRNLPKIAHNSDHNIGPGMHRKVFRKKKIFFCIKRNEKLAHDLKRRHQEARNLCVIPMFSG